MKYSPLQKLVYTAKQILLKKRLLPQSRSQKYVNYLVINIFLLFLSFRGVQSHQQFLIVELLADYFTAKEMLNT